MDRAARVRVPARRALAAEEGEKDEAVVAGIAFRERSRRVGERPLEPVVEVAAIGQRSALDDAVLVGEIEEEPRPRLRLLALVEDPERAGRTNHERGAVARRAARAGVRAGGVRPELYVVDLGEPVAVDAECCEQLLVPGECGEVEQPARRCHPEARPRLAAKQ